MAFPDDSMVGVTVVAPIVWSVAATSSPVVGPTKRRTPAPMAVAATVVPMRDVAVAAVVVAVRAENVSAEAVAPAISPVADMTMFNLIPLDKVTGTLE